MIVVRVFIVIFVGCFVIVGTSNLHAQADVIERRKKMMKSNSAASKEIKSALGTKGYATVASKARQIAGVASDLPRERPPEK